MTFCTKSRSRQWTLWLCAAGVALILYIVISLFVCGSVNFNLSDPCRYRLAVSLLVLFGIFAWETRWDGIWRDEDDFIPFSADIKKETSKSLPTASAPVVQAVVAVETGEELFVRAQQLHHQPIPDPFVDREYFRLLGCSAAKGHVPAMAKLGEHAMDRETWVEAYYWMWQARRKGRADLESQLREIRESWILDGFPEEIENVNDLFTVEKGSIGRALLHLDSRYDEEGAREFLQTNYPDCLGAISF